MTNSKITSLLGDKLIDNQNQSYSVEDTLKGKAGFLVYFSAHWCGPCRSFTPELIKIYNSVLKDKSEVIFCSFDKNEEEFKSYFSEMPWKAIPFSSPLREKMRDSLNVSSIPTLISFDAEGNILSKEAKTMALNDKEAKNYPWKDKSIKELVGDVVDNKNQTMTSSELEKLDVLALYFSAHWCGPCKAFTPQLAETYKTLKAEGKNFEIVFCSSDRDEKSFEEYFATMPWKALPYSRREDKEALSRRFSIRGIPSLILLDGKTHKVITDSGVQNVYSDTAGKEFPWKPKPLMRLSNESMSKINSGGRLLVMLLDGVTDETKRDQFEAALRNVATKKTEEWEPLEQRPLYFTYGRKDWALVPQVRQFLKLGAAKDEANVVIVDGKSALSFTFTGEPTEENLTEFVNKFVEGKLSGKSLQ